jgi:UDP-glucose 6-dehydrogenase
MLHISVIGCGHVGLVMGACLAAAGHEVTCTDIDCDRIACLNASFVPIFEWHLDEASKELGSRMPKRSARKGFCGRQR